MRGLALWVFMALILFAAALSTLAVAPASAEILRHRATGFSAKAPSDFAVGFHRQSARYSIASRRRQAAISYQRIRTGYSPRVAGRLLARRSGADVAREWASRQAFIARLSDGRVLGVRRSSRRLLMVTRVQRRAWSGPRRRLLTRIRRSIRGGRAVPLAVPRKARRRERPQPKPSSQTKPAGLGGEVLFRSDFESGTFAGFYVQSLSERARITSGGAFGSRHAARFEVREGDVEPDTGSERSEVSLSSPMFDEGQDVYFRDSFRVPRGSSIGSSWQIINQLHEDEWDGSPGIAVFLEPGPTIRIGAGDGSPTFLRSAPIQYDRWHDLVYRANLSRDPEVGFMEVWLDGVQLTMANGQPRIHGQTIQTPRGYLKAGIYRGRASTGTSIIEHDNITIATTLQTATGGN